MKVLAFFLSCLLAQSGFCQAKEQNFITQEKALQIAKRHGLYPLIKLKNRLGWFEVNWMEWGGAQARLDTAAAVWELSSDKLTYRDWGKTTKLGKKDRCQKCKFINGCHVHRTRKVRINAFTGKFLKMEKFKKVSGNYE